jgi:TolB protein
MPDPVMSRLGDHSLDRALNESWPADAAPRPVLGAGLVSVEPGIPARGHAPSGALFQEAPMSIRTATRSKVCLIVAPAAAVALSVVPSAPALATAQGHNGRIAYREYFNAAHTRGAIFTVNPDGTGTRQVTHPRRSRLTTEPDWSPNGRWIEYQLSRHGNTDVSRLYKIRPNGTDRTFIDASCQAPCRSDGFAQWSPHGRRIAFQRQSGPAGDPTFLFALYVMRADGTHVRQITHVGADPLVDHRFQDHAPTWSPTAKRLAFERVDGKSDLHAIFTIRLDGSALRRITPWALDASQPDWSPNGRWILFRSHEGSDTQGNVWLVRPNGDRRHAVTHTPDGAGKWQSGSFSPNGKKITAGKAPGAGPAGNADVYVMNVDGSGRRNVTKSTPWESAPDWGPARK